MKTMNKKIRLVLGVFVLAWSAIILFLSSQSGEASAQTSSYLAKPLVDWICGLYRSRLNPQGEYGVYLAVQWFVRKTAHFAEYAIWGGLLLGFLTACQKRMPVLWTTLFSVLFAACDELFQLLFGRSGMWQDVLLDTVGAAAGAVFTWLAVCAFCLQRQTFHKSEQ